MDESLLGNLYKHHLELHNGRNIVEKLPFRALLNKSVTLFRIALLLAIHICWGKEHLKEFSTTVAP